MKKFFVGDKDRNNILLNMYKPLKAYSTMKISEAKDLMKPMILALKTTASLKIGLIKFTSMRISKKYPKTTNCRQCDEIHSENSELSEKHSAKLQICLNNYYLDSECEIAKNIDGELNLRLIQKDIFNLRRNRGKGSIPKPDYSYHVQGHQTELPFLIRTLSELVN